MPDSAHASVPSRGHPSLDDASVGADPESHPPPEQALVREPLQDRSRRTLERLVAAAARLLEARGPEGVTVTGVSREARTSVGAFYARFSGKEEMVRYLGERWLTEAQARWDEVTSSLEPGNALGLRGGITELATLYLNGPARRLTLLDGQDDPPPRRLRRFEDRVARTLSGAASGAGRAGSVEENGETQDQTHFLRAAALVAGLRELGLRAADGSGPSAGLGSGALAEIMMGLSEGVDVAPGPDPSPEGPAPEVSAGTPAPPAGTGSGETESGDPPPPEATQDGVGGPGAGEVSAAGDAPAVEDAAAPEDAAAMGESQGGQAPEERQDPEDGEEPEIFDVWG